MEIVAQCEQWIARTTIEQLPELIGALVTLQEKARLKMLAAQAKGADELLTIPEVASRLKVSEYRAYELARQGVIKSVRLGKSVRVKPEDLADYLSKAGG